MTGPRDIVMALPSGHLPRVGKVRTGIKKEHTKEDGGVLELPSAVDYFVVNHDKVTNRLSAESFDRVYGKEPRELDVTLPAPRTDDVLSGAYRRYKAGELLERKCTGPGGVCVVRGSEGEWISGACQCELDGLDPELNAIAKKANGRTVTEAHCAKRWTFNFLMMHVSGLGIWQWDTGSVIAAEGIASTLLMIEQFRGHLQGAECKLRIVPRKVAPKGKSKTVYIVELGAGNVTPAEALKVAAGARRVELPPSSLDELPDPMLDHESIENAGALPAPSASNREGGGNDVAPAVVDVEPHAAPTREPVPASVARDGLTIDSLEAAKTVLRGCTPVQREAFLDLLGLVAPATLGQVAAALLAKHRGANSVDVVRKAMS